MYTNFCLEKTIKIRANTKREFKKLNGPCVKKTFFVTKWIDNVIIFFRIMLTANAYTKVNARKMFNL